ncbi:hypothetical protein IMZ48_23485, partial [Candidatus Bathyarchaeota archaeon]|nr:hypothetical protein [Candidatus Bathyarchaeota archaeon]
VFFCAPVAVVLLMHQRKAERLGLLEKPASGRTWYQSILHYTIELDGEFPNPPHCLCAVFSIRNKHFY